MEAGRNLTLDKEEVNRTHLHCAEQAQNCTLDSAEEERTELAAVAASELTVTSSMDVRTMAALRVCVILGAARGLGIHTLCYWTSIKSAAFGGFA